MRRTLNIRTLIVIALVASMLPVALGQEVKKEGEKTHNNVEKQILLLEKEWYGAFFRSDADTMSRIEADDFIIITGGTNEGAAVGQHQRPQRRAQAAGGCSDPQP